MARISQLGKVTLADGRELVGASFRGVPFHTVVSEVRVGRRNVVNEYPQRDIPWVDDMGRKARRIVLDAYVIGADHFNQRDKLIEAFETEGAGELIHPRFGSLNVALDGDASIKEESDRSGMSHFSVTFVESGENKFPVARTSTVAQLEAKTNVADRIFQEKFVKDFSVSGPSVLAAQAVAALNKDVASLLATARLVTSVEAQANIVGLAGLLSSNLASLIRTPVLLVQNLRSLLAATVQNVNRPVLAIGEVQSMFTSNRLPGSAASVTSTRSRALANDSERAALQRRLALTTQARMLAVAISNTDTVPTAAQATALRNALVAQVDVELEEYDPPSEVANALCDVRAAVVQDVALRCEFLLQRSSFTPASVLPALVLAHRIYQDAGRADELVNRNDVRHPAFMPARALEVLK